MRLLELGGRTKLTVRYKILIVQIAGVIGPHSALFAHEKPGIAPDSGAFHSVFLTISISYLGPTPSPSGLGRWP